MGKVSTAAAKSAEAAISREQGEQRPLEAPQSGNLLEGISGSAANAAEAEASVPQPSQSIQSLAETAPSAQARQQGERAIAPRPSYIESEVAATMKADPRMRQAPFTPQPTLMTPGQVSERRSTAQLASDIMRESRSQLGNGNGINVDESDLGKLASKTSPGMKAAASSVESETETEEPIQPMKDTAVEREKFDDGLSKARESAAPDSGIGIVKKPKAPDAPQGWMRKRFKGIVEKREKEVDREIKRIEPGNSFFDKILGDSKVPPHCVSIGTENLVEAIREPGSKIVDYVNQETGLELEVQQCLDDISILMDAINNAGIEVVLDKDPINKKGMMQTRTLRVHVGACIRLHPTQVKSYNADFDGDTGKIIVDKKYVKRYPRATSTLIDIDGNPNIDPDFFIIPAINGKDRKKVLKLLKKRRFSWNPEIADGIFDAYFTVSNAPTKENWLKFLRKIDEVAGKKSGSAKERNENISMTLASVYDFSNDRNDLIIKEQVGSLSDEYSNFTPPDPSIDPFVVKLVDKMDEVIAGRRAPNLQEFTRFYNKFYGEANVGEKLENPKAQSKNVPFRLVADLGKAVNRSEFILIGDDVPVRVDDDVEFITLEKFYQVTCAAMESKVIAGRMHMGSHKLVPSTHVRTMVLNEVGLPNPSVPYSDWLASFVDSYNYHQRLLATTKSLKFRADMRIVQHHDFNDIVKAGNLGKALIDVYGDFPFNQVFPHLQPLHYRDEAKLSKRSTSNGAVLASYLDMPLRMFAMNSKLDYNMGELEKRFGNGTLTEFDVMNIVSDRGRADTIQYGKNWEKWTQAFFGIMPKMENAGFDAEQHLCDMLDIMTLAGADVFDFYGMENFAKFTQSEWGKKLLNAETVEEFRSTWVSMLVRYRVDRAMRIKAEKREYADMVGIAEDERSIVLNALSQAHVDELDTLASSSMAWSAIVDEAYDGSSVYKRFANAMKKQANLNGRMIDLNAARFWASGKAREYGSLYDFLVSDEAYFVKMDALSDVVRFRHNYMGVMSFEMIGQLAHHPNRTVEGSPFDMSSGLDSEPFKTSIDRLSSYLSKFPKRARKYAKTFLASARANKGKFESFIAKLASDPGFLVHVDPYLAADAMASVHDKDYADTEKGQQQYRVSAYFQALAQRDGGGYFTHLQQTDNKVMNVVGFDQLTVVDLVRVIGDPDMSLNVYDEYGRPGVLSRRTLCGGDSIDDVLEWIEDNPSMAYLFRRHTVSVNADTKGTVSLYGVDSTDFDIEEDDEHVNFNLLCDRPKFFALSALITPIGLDTGRTLAQKHHDTIMSLSNLIGYYANMEVQQSIIDDFSRVTGLTEEAIIEASRECKFSNGSGMGEDQAKLMYREAMMELLECVGIVREKGVKRSSPDYGFASDYGEAKIDPNSIVAYYDVRQQLSGSRTSTMIGVEGSVTGDVEILLQYFKQRKDRFITVGDHLRHEEIDKLGHVTGRDLFDEIDESVNGLVVIDREQYPELKDWSPSDLTLERDRKRQLTSTAKFLEVKRENAAERFNMKSAAFGDDGLNSIIKYRKLDIDAGNDLIKKLDKAKTRIEAIEILAKALEQADRDLGYIDVGITFMPSDYMNRADLMLAKDENGDLARDANSHVVVRTMEQLAAACRSRLTVRGVNEGTDALMSELDMIVNTAGTTNDQMAMVPDAVAKDVAHRSRKARSTKNIKADRAVLERASSQERNYTELYRVYKKFKKDKGKFIPWSRKESETHSRMMFAKLKDEKTKQAIRGIAFPTQRWDPNLEAFVNNSFDDTYNYLGRPTDEGFQIQPGFQNLVLFEGSPDGESDKVLEECKTYGVTVAFNGEKSIPPKYADDVQDLGNGLYSSHSST